MHRMDRKDFSHNQFSTRIILLISLSSIFMLLWQRTKTKSHCLIYRRKCRYMHKIINKILNLMDLIFDNGLLFAFALNVLISTNSSMFFDIYSSYVI